MTLPAASPVNIGSSRFVRLGNGRSTEFKIRCPPNEISGAPQRDARSIKGPISVPVSPSTAVKCYPCREVTLNYNRSLLFHGGDTGSTPVRDAKLEFIFVVYQRR
jgi:hypothetical protein